MGDPRRDAVLILRPEPGASTTAEKVQALGFRALTAPVLVYDRVDRVIPHDLEAAQAAVLTSAAAAKAVGEDLQRRQIQLPAYCVGAKTAEAARDAGFQSIVTGEGDAAALLKILSRLDPTAGPLLILRGREVAFPLADRLAEGGFETVERVVYAANAAASLPSSAVTSLRNGEVAAAIFLSARTAEVFLELAPAEDALQLSLTRAVCNSARTAAPLRKAAVFASVEVAAEPSLKATLSLLSSLR